MITFFKAALKNIGQTGSVVESSGFLTSKMTDNVDFRKTLHIVELGAGTGNITKSILEKMNNESRLTSFEIDPVLFSQLRKNGDKRLTWINADASLISDHIKGQTVDYIISGLPLANIPSGKKESILDSCYHVLKSGGYYIQFQYSLNDFKLLKQVFAKVDSCFTLLNFPPAFIYYAQK